MSLELGLKLLYKMCVAFYVQKDYVYDELAL